MSIDLSRVTGISDSRGVITEIKDSLGRVIWAVSGGKAVLMVEKITSDTYAGETAYTGEQFILLDIYPKTNGTVKVTYGGLTKTITDTSGAAEPNAQQVFFGTFNGVTDSVATPASGELTIKGDYYAFGCSTVVTNNKGGSTTVSCITSVVEWQGVTIIPEDAFYNCDKITSVTIPEGVKAIENDAFSGCGELVITELPNSLVSIGSYAFRYSPKIKILEIPEGVTTIGNGAFQAVVGLEGATTPPMVNENIVLPSTLRSLGTNVWSYFSAKYYCYLGGITIRAVTPPEATGGALFENANDLKFIIVPKGSGDAYKTATGWSTYASLIVEES